MQDEYGREFRYACPSCNEDVEGCPDPACENEGVGHHVSKVPEWCDHQDNDVPLRAAKKRFTGKIEYGVMGSPAMEESNGP
tara:strand:+ start:2711 stop:2953 length:243 start_codon:yes stop_codon:yes gene_type:complete